jgi:hypothetical protein
MKRFGRMMLVAAVLLTGSVVAALADPALSSNAPAADNVKTLALRWYTQMQAAQLDHTQLTAAYSAQLTDDAVREMARKVNLYGAPPTSAEILRTRTIADQIFYLVKLIFPRGDAASLLIGFDPQGKITGINFVSMAGD